MFHRTELKHRHFVTDEITSAALRDHGHRFFDADLCLSRVVLRRSMSSSRSATSQYPTMSVLPVWFDAQQMLAIHGT